jgi:putative phosphoesterase
LPPGAVKPGTDASLRVGLVSDTHGLLRPEVEAFLQGSDHIVHAGDIGDAAILARLSHIAPLTAVRGNNDSGPWAERLDEIAVVRIAGLGLYVIHDVAQLDLAQVPADAGVIVFGHSHKPVVEPRGDRLYVNPGSAGPRRFKLPIAAAELVIKNGMADVRLRHFPW